MIFAFPGIEPGVIIEYKLKEVISNASANNLRLQFQRDIPVQSATYHIKPERTNIVIETATDHHIITLKQTGSTN